jgi:inhibitor of cysteine peptidase
MRKTAIMLALLLALATAFAGCGKTEAAYGKDDTSISVKNGDTFTIKLEANPTTGYEWSAAISDESVLALEKSEYLPDEAVSGAVGAGGTQVLTFKASKAGSATIDLVYQRSWEPSEDDQRIQYAVTVS